VRDPGLIKFDAAGELDLFTVHGRFLVESAPNLLDEPYVGLVTNAAGQVFRGTLVPAQMQAVGSGRSPRYRFKDREAKKYRGDADGIHRAVVKFQTRKGQVWCRFKVKAYADLSAATVPLMTTQVAVGEAKGTLTAQWTQTSHGWKLRDKLFASE
jgi:hypothetical protein